MTGTKNDQGPTTNDDIFTYELMQLVTESGSFDWLSSDEEDIYSIDDGDEVQWASVS